MEGLAELLQTTSTIPPLILVLLISSISYYAVASLLIMFPPASGLGLVLLGRVHKAKLNWHAHVIRSLLETGFWIGVIGFTYFGEDGKVISGLNKEKLLTSVAWGTMSGVGVVLLGDRMENYLSQCKNISVRVMNVKKDLQVESTQGRENNDSDRCASIGAFSLLYIFYFVGYHALSCIFLLPCILCKDGYNCTLNFFVLPVLLATLAGVTFTAAATILVQLWSTEKFGRLLLTRVTYACDNWIYHTKRSTIELGTWLLIVVGSFHLRYYGWDGLVTLLGAEHFCLNLNLSDSGSHNDLLRMTRAIVWALQLGTIAGSTLVFCSHCMYGEEVDREHAPKADMVQGNVGPCAINNASPIRQKARKEGLVLYDGDWYSVGKFVKYHPGGAEVLEQYLGTDISYVFRVMHRDPNKIMQHRKPVRAATPDELKELLERRREICHDMMGEFQIKANLSASDTKLHKEKFDLESFEKDGIVLWDQFVENGYFKPSRIWIVRNTIVLYSLLALSIICMKVLSPSCFVIPGIFLGLFWHQSGYLMHDAEHHNVAGNELVNDILGWMYGTVCLGVNGAWWREEHREHHAFLNTYDSKGFKDPQMREDIWIQNKKLVPFFGDELIHFLTNFQHILFLPVIFLAGRIGIVIDSTLTERKFRPWTKLGNVCHFLLHYVVLSQAPRPVSVYIVASLWQAILSLQLLGNHYVKPWNCITDATEGNFFLWQVLATQDFSCPKWARWFYGGLNFHYSHHLFPTLSREYFHLTTPLIRSLCEKHGLPFQEIGFVDCVSGMVANFDDVRKEFREHGRGSIALFYT